MSFVARIIHANALVYELRVPINAEERFFILEVAPAKRAAFLAAVAADTGYILEDFGTVLHRGWGEPPEALKRELHRVYGMYEGDIAKRIAQPQFRHTHPPKTLKIPK